MRKVAARSATSRSPTISPSSPRLSSSTKSAERHEWFVGAHTQTPDSKNRNLRNILKLNKLCTGCSLLDGRRRERLGGHGSRSARFRHQVLHGRRHLGSGRQQHAHIFHSRSDPCEREISLDLTSVCLDFFILSMLLILSQFPSFIHTQKRNPVTHLKDPNMFWDFITLRPETCHQVSFLFSDRGTPDGFRHMNGYGSHTFKLVNAKGGATFVKFHFKTDQGIKNLSAERAAQLAGENPDYAIEDLYNSIARSEFPSWTLKVQLMSEEQAARCSFNPFDVTKVWPQKDYPLRPVGRLVLDQNPKNYFADIEQIAFSPSHLIPGVEASADKMLQGRLFSYPDAHVRFKFVFHCCCFVFTFVVFFVSHRGIDWAPTTCKYQSTVLSGLETISATDRRRSTTINAMRPTTTRTRSADRSTTPSNTARRRLRTAALPSATTPRTRTTSRRSASFGARLSTRKDASV